MGRSKATIMLDRAKTEQAMSLTGARSMSDVVDVALAQLIGGAQLRADLQAYRRRPSSNDEVALATLPVVLDLDDDVDYEALYGAGE